MIIFKKRAEKEKQLIEKLETECEEKNVNAKWENITPNASNKYKLLKRAWKVSHKSRDNWACDGPYGWAIRTDIWECKTKCSITELICVYGGDCRTCVEPIMSKLVTFKYP